MRHVSICYTAVAKKHTGLAWRLMPIMSCLREAKVEGMTEPRSSGGQHGESLSLPYLKKKKIFFKTRNTAPHIIPFERKTFVHATSFHAQIMTGCQKGSIGHSSECQTLFSNLPPAHMMPTSLRPGQPLKPE